MTQKIAKSAAAVAAPPTTETEIEPIKSPFCRELRSKRFFFLQEMPTDESDIVGEDRHCWCFLTMQSIGPDGEMVQPKECAPGRTCYKSVFEA